MSGATGLSGKSSSTLCSSLMTGLSMGYHVRVLVPVYKEELDIVQRTVLAAREAGLPAGESSLSALLTFNICDVRLPLWTSFYVGFPSFDLDYFLQFRRHVCCACGLIGLSLHGVWVAERRLHPHHLPPG